MVAALSFAAVACGSSSGSSSKSFCDKIVELSESDDFEFETLSDEEATKRMSKAFKDLEASAPGEVKSSVAELANAMEAVANIDMSDPEAMMAAGENLDEEKLEEASQKLDDYVKNECGIDLDE